MFVMDSPPLRTKHAVCTVKFVKSFATWQHRLDVDSDFLSCLASLSSTHFLPECNQTPSVTLHVRGSDFLPQILSKFVQYSCDAKNIFVAVGSGDDGT